MILQNGLKASDVLIIFALPDEAQKQFESCGANVVFSGIGKINAAYQATKAILELRPKLVLNFGTAGSPRFPTHTLVECTRFIQRDIDLSPLGFERGVTPFDPSPTVFEVPRRFKDLPDGTCGTADNFEISLGGAKEIATVVEMEAYAIAKVCYLQNVPFACFKYITDGSDDSASKDWVANVPLAAKRFAEHFPKILTDVLPS